MLDDVPQWYQMMPWLNSSSSHFDSRTRKRYRDIRPDEKTIHTNTYELLFAAARSPPPPIMPSIYSDEATTQIQPSPPQRQPSLRNFWTISSPPPPLTNTTSVPISQDLSACEDCERPLPMSNSDIYMGGMDVDGPNGEGFACRTSRKRVCDMCAVVQIGMGRNCLQCMTTRKKWVGGIGWVP